MIALIIILCLLVFVVISDFRAGPAVRTSPFMEKSGKPIIRDGVIIDNLLVRPMASVDFYTANLKKVDFQHPIQKPWTNIATLNVHGFKSINLNHTRNDCMEAVLEFMKKFAISVLAIQGLPDNTDDFRDLLEGARLHHTDIDQSTAVISIYPITEKQYTEHAIWFKVLHPIYKDKLFCAAHLCTDATQGDKVVGRKLQIKDIFAHGQGPDIIMGDLNLVPDSPEYALLNTKYKISSHVDFTTMHRGSLAIKDYIWFRKRDPTATWRIETYAVNYIWSDHRPVVGVYLK